MRPSGARAQGCGTGLWLGEERKKMADTREELLVFTQEHVQVQPEVEKCGYEGSGEETLR